jgi:hypothetical protein
MGTLHDDNLANVVRVVALLQDDHGKILGALSLRGPICIHLNRISELGHKNSAMVSGEGFNFIDPEGLTMLPNNGVETLRDAVAFLEALGIPEADLLANGLEKVLP